MCCSRHGFDTSWRVPTTNRAGLVPAGPVSSANIILTIMKTLDDIKSGNTLTLKQVREVLNSGDEKAKAALVARSKALKDAVDAAGSDPNKRDEAVKDLGKREAERPRSAFNDGVYIRPISSSTDESVGLTLFDGTDRNGKRYESAALAVLVNVYADAECTQLIRENQALHKHLLNWDVFERTDVTPGREERVIEHVSGSFSLSTEFAQANTLEQLHAALITFAGGFKALQVRLTPFYGRRNDGSIGKRSLTDLVRV